MQDYNRELDQLLSMQLPPLAPLPPGNYVIYGAGNIGREIAAKLAGSEKKVCAVLDQRATGRLGEIPIYSPDSAEAGRFAAEGMTAIIGVFNYAVDPQTISALLKKLGYQHIVSFLEFQELFNLPPHFWLTSRRHVLDHQERVRAAWKLLEDDKSRDVYLDALRLRLTFDTNLMREPELEQQYLPDDLPRPKMPLRFIDGGAFNGDTLEFLLGKGATFEAIAAFEPDPDNFRALRATVRKNGDALGETTLWPCGISDKTMVASFSAGRGEGSVLSEDGNIHIQLAALDEVMPSFRPNYIKLDIEGSEPAALRGGAEMIKKYQPAITVCLYHCPDHLWEIPLYLREILPGHTIALRYHRFQAFELVAYALPVASA